ncbi:MAG: alpha-1,4-glucan--maltose-1-phosphate maltosyltransferase [Verrucomicrobiota bacterium]
MPRSRKTAQPARPLETPVPTAEVRGHSAPTLKQEKIERKAAKAEKKASSKKAEPGLATPLVALPPAELTGRRRIVIEHVAPAIDGGEFPVKRIVGDTVEVTAAVFGDGHDQIRALLRHRPAQANAWDEIPLEFKENDQWGARFAVVAEGFHEFQIEAWMDHFESWRHGLQKKVEGGAEVHVELLAGRELLRETAQRAATAGGAADAKALEGAAESLVDVNRSERERAELALNPGLQLLAERYPDRSLATRSQAYPLLVEREKARCSAWYEFFPRSWGEQPGEHGTFQTAARILPEIARLGFDTVYLPPVHPIGTAHRKGKNNRLEAAPDDVGSPWAIGAAEGGHKAIHPQLGTLADFRRFVQEAEKNGLEVALDIAFQCSPDHPYVKEHPQWFKWRADGTVQYAENPPKKYQDVLPLNFETEDWENLWLELRSVFEHWVEQGVKIFRVDNPHTKPLEFWRWLIADLKAKHPDVLLLAEAFTRPHVMYRLGKVGFTWGYTYFTWRHGVEDLTAYVEELTKTEVKDQFRPNFWPNTPDIHPPTLRYDGRPAFITRLVLAATLSSNYGLYGPVYELCEAEGMEGKEELLNNEKYELRWWDWDRPGNLKEIMAQINKIRRQNPALQQTNNILFAPTDNPALLAYAKYSDDRQNLILCVVNLDPRSAQAGFVNVPTGELGLGDTAPYLVKDLLADGRYLWRGARNYVRLEPWVCPAHIFRINKEQRREENFEYFL